MDIAVTIFKEGGPWMYGILALSMFGIPVGVLAVMVIGALRWRIPSTIAWLGPTATLAIGYIGTWVGARRALAAAEVLPPEDRAHLAAVGAAVAQYPGLSAELVAGVGFLAIALAAALPAAIAPGPEPRLDVRSLLGAVGGGVLGGLLALIVVLISVGVGVVLDLMVPTLVLVAGAGAGTLATVIASARVASEDRVHQGRIAGTRGFVLVSATLGVLLLGEAFRRFEGAEALRAAATASPETVATLTGYGQTLSVGASHIAWALAIPVFLAGCLGLFPIFGRADGRVGLGAGIGGVQLVTVGVLWLMVASAIGRLA